jgi:ABC-2 type transport system permease protein
VNATANEGLEIPAEVTVSDVGWRLSPIRQYGGSILAIFVSVFGGMIIMMNLVEEKQENTLAAMNVAPVERITFILGKGLLGFVVPVIQVFGVLYIMDYGPIDYLKVLVVTLAIAAISVMIGFLIGVTNDNVIGAISSMKVLFIPILGSIFGAIFLREGLHFLFYWSPFYWAFRAMDPIILREATWSNTLLFTGVILLISLLVFGGLRKRIDKGLN